MKAKTRYGEPIIPGRVYAFQDIAGVARYQVVRTIDERGVEVRGYGYSGTRWACNALYEITT